MSILSSNKKCITKRCKNTSAYGNSLCWKCIKKKYKENNPTRYAYSILKNNAKRRGHSFELSFEQFEQFCVKYNYIGSKGKRSDSYSIDRIDNSKGYVIGNIQIMTFGENARKGIKTMTAYYDHLQKKVVGMVSTDISENLNKISENFDKIMKENHENCECCNHVPF